MTHADYRVPLKCCACGKRIGSVSAEAVRRVIAAGGFVLARYASGQTNDQLLRRASDVVLLKCQTCEPTLEA